MGLIGLRGIGQNERLALNRRSENSQGKHSWQKKKNLGHLIMVVEKKINLFISFSVQKEVRGRKKSSHMYTEEKQQRVFRCRREVVQVVSQKGETYLCGVSGFCHLLNALELT